eukprot:COSAG01_NODE_12181_length_1785_cov_2.890273_2_plen_59_part_01
MPPPPPPRAGGGRRQSGGPTPPVALDVAPARAPVGEKCDRPACVKHGPGGGGDAYNNSV